MLSYVVYFGLKINIFDDIVDVLELLCYLYLEIIFALVALERKRFVKYWQMDGAFIHLESGSK
jgi:hypothetical protein